MGPIDNDNDDSEPQTPLGLGLGERGATNNGCYQGPQSHIYHKVECKVTRGPNSKQSANTRTVKAKIKTKTQRRRCARVEGSILIAVSQDPCSNGGSDESEGIWP